MLDCHVSFYCVNNLVSQINLRLLIIYKCITDMAYSEESMVCLTVSRNSSLGDALCLPLCSACFSGLMWRYPFFTEHASRLIQILLWVRLAKLLVMPYGSDVSFLYRCMVGCWQIKFPEGSRDLIGLPLV